MPIIALVLCILPTPDKEVSSLQQLLRPLEQVKKSAYRVTAKVQMSQDGPTRQSHIWSESSFALIADFSEPEDVTHARILNDDYISTVKKSEAGWAVSELVLDSAPSYATASKSLTGSNAFASFCLVRLVGPTYGGTDTSLTRVLADPSNYELSVLQSEPDKIRLAIAVDSTFQEGEAMRPAKYVVSFTSNNITKLIVSIPEAPGGEYVEEYSYEKYEQRGKTSLPALVVLKSKITPPDEDTIEDTTTITLDYEQFDEPFDTDRCYLTYYGLAEPAGVRKAGWPWYAVGGGLILVAILLIRRKGHHERRT